MQVCSMGENVGAGMLSVSMGLRERSVTSPVQQCQRKPVEGTCPVMYTAPVSKVNHFCRKYFFKNIMCTSNFSNTSSHLFCENLGQNRSSVSLVLNGLNRVVLQTRPQKPRLHGAVGVA